MTLARLARGQGSTPCWGTEFFWIANGHFDPLLHLVANVISELEMHEDMFLLRGVNVTVISVSLVV